jgi:DUF1009 family protein
MLPLRLYEYCKHQDIELCPILFHGQNSQLTPNMFPKHRVLTCYLGQLAKIFGFFKKNQITDAVFIGGIQRPAWRDIHLDLRGVITFMQMRWYMAGDDTVLSACLQCVEKQGLTVHPIQKFLSYLCPSQLGVLTKKKPSLKTQKQIIQSLIKLDMISICDIGQSMAIQDGMVLSVEAIEGTDRMIRRTKNLVRTAADGPVLLKIAKKNQDLRVDMPTIGPETIDHLAHSGFSGVVVQKNKILCVDFDVMIEKANQHGLFIAVVDKICDQNGKEKWAFSA